MNLSSLKNKSSIKIMILALITAIIMATSSIVIYSNVFSPKFYEQFINMGIKYLQEEKYEEAILAFDKAIQINERSTGARIGIAKGYAGTGKFDEAIEILKETQKLDINNKELLIEILEILKNIDPYVAYEILSNYIENIGANNLTDDIKDMVNKSQEVPENPIVSPSPGTYINPIDVKLMIDELKVGHSFYYTVDGSEPSKSSDKYRGSIKVEDDITIKLIGYNPKGESTEVITFNYIIDTEIKSRLQGLIKEGQTLVDSIQVGVNPGNCIEGAKEDFTATIDTIKKELNNSNINYDKVNELINGTNNTIDKFREKIIQETNKNELKNTIDNAQTLYNDSKEGNKEGDFKSGSKSILQNAINIATQVYDDILSRQADINKATNILKGEISKFNNSKVSKMFTAKMARQIILNKYGSPGEGFNFFVEEPVKIKNGVKYYYVSLNQTYENGDMYPSCAWGLYEVYENGNIIQVSLDY